jgi:hypothetical protein
LSISLHHNVPASTQYFQDICLWSGHKTTVLKVNTASTIGE